jgi:hypothetical protein
VAPGEPFAGESRTFRRSLWARLVSVVALLLFGLGLAQRTSSAPPGIGWFVLFGLTVASLGGVVSAWGDRVTIDARGVEARNIFLAKLGNRPPFAARRLAWAEVIRVQEHRRPGASPVDPPRALFLVSARKRRLALDSLEDFETVVALVRAARERTKPRPDAD